MRSSLKSKQRRTRRDSEGRGHVRPVTESRLDAALDMEPRRMVPRSQATSTPSVGQRRSERRATKRGRVQAQRSTPNVKRRTLSPAQVFSWRAVSGMIVLGLTVVLYLFFTAEAFFVNSVSIGGEKYLSREEIFRDSKIAQRHVFWVDPLEVEKQLESIPNIADATVFVGWPPDMVQIVVTEREPALIWEQGIRVWVDVNGIVMKQREDRPEMLRIVVPNATEPLSAGSRIAPTIIQGALYLRSRHPNVDVLLYDPIKGLGYHDSRGWTVWFGSGDEMDVKLLVYNQIVEDIWEQVQPGEIIMSDPDRPYYTVLWRKTNE